MTARQPADGGTRLPVTLPVPGDFTPAEQRAHLPKCRPDEGGAVHDQTIARLRHRLEDALTTDERKAWISALKHQAQMTVLDDGRSVTYHIGSPKDANYAPTERRYGIVAGLVAIVEAGAVEADDQSEADQLVRGFAAAALGCDDWPHFQNIPTGAVIGCLDADQARTFYQLCEHYA
jgi:hypothetical protein